MPPVSPGQPSSFGSVFADSPGLLRENGWTFTYTMSPTSLGGPLPICSATTGPTDVTDFQPVLAPLGPGDSLNIYGIQAACAATAEPLTFSLRRGAHTATSATTLSVGTSNRQGPWFQHFELPLQIEGPPVADGSGDVWVEIIKAGNIPTYNRLTFECIVVRKS